MPDYPLKRLYIQPTDRCNLSCVFCWRNHVKDDSWLRNRELSDGKWLEVTADACGLGAEHITITGGGEPMLRKGLVSAIMRKACSFSGKVRSGITTNGTLIDESFLEDIKGLNTYVCISFHGSDEKTNDALMGKDGTFRRIMHSLSLIDAFRKRNGTPYPFVSCHFVLTKENYMQMDEMLALMVRTGIDHIGFRMLTPDSVAANNHLQIGPSEFAEIRKRVEPLREAAKRHSKGVDFEFGMDTPKDEGKVEHSPVYCTLPFFELIALPDGTANPCCTYRDNYGETLSDSLAGKSLAEVWHGEKFERFRQLMIERKPTRVCMMCLPDTKTYRETIGYQLDMRERR